MGPSIVNAASRLAAANHDNAVESGPADSPLFQPQDPNNDATLNIDTDSIGCLASKSSEGEMEPTSSILPSSPPMASDQSTNHNLPTRYRQDGTTPMAVHNAITAGTSWIDETILRMRKAGYSTKDVADYLRKKSNGEVDYDPKTIGTRYARITKLLEEQAEQRLDDELTDWQAGEDEELVDAVDQVDAEIQQEIKKIKAKRFELAARKLQSKIKKDIAYSASSCRKRYFAIQNDTATIPIELDDHPEQRLIQRQQKSIRLAEEIHKAESAKEEAKNKKKLEKDKRELEYKQKKEEQSRKRHEKDAQDLQKLADRLAKREAQNEATEKRQQKEAARIAELQSSLTTGISTRPDPLTPGQKRKANALNGASSTESAFAKSAALPRGKMTLAELQSLCKVRKVSKTGTKAEIQERLQDEAKNATSAELRSRLCLYGADTEGTKKELVERLAQADEANFEWVQNNGASKRPRKRTRTSMLSKPIVESSSDDESGPAAGTKAKSTYTTTATKDSDEEHETSDDETEINKRPTKVNLVNRGAGSRAASLSPKPEPSTKEEPLSDIDQGVKRASLSPPAAATTVPATVQAVTAAEPVARTSSAQAINGATSRPSATASAAATTTTTTTTTAVSTILQASTAGEPTVTSPSAHVMSEAERLTTGAQRMRSATPRETRDMFAGIDMPGMRQDDLALLRLGQVFHPDNFSFLNGENSDTHEINVSSSSE